jgi:hypothetical protein
MNSTEPFGTGKSKLIAAFFRDYVPGAPLIFVDGIGNDSDDEIIILKLELEAVTLLENESTPESE